MSLMSREPPTATHCKRLQHTATHSIGDVGHDKREKGRGNLGRDVPCLYSARLGGMLQCVAVCCSVLQSVAACCSELQWVVVCYSLPLFFSSGRCVAVCCGVLRCVAVCCSVLQCVAVGCSVL